MRPDPSLDIEPAPLGWRHLGLAALMALCSTVYAGMPLNPYAPSSFALLATTWASHLLQIGLPVLLLTRLADRALARGAALLPAYGVVLLLVLLWGQAFVLPLQELISQGQVKLDLARRWGETMKLFLPLALGLGAYAQWRRAQLSAARLRAWQLAGQQARGELQAARLQALQARVEPEELLQRLRAITTLAGQDAAAADSVLVDLIAQLRTRLAQGAEAR